MSFSLWTFVQHVLAYIHLKLCQGKNSPHVCVAMVAVDTASTVCDQGVFDFYLMRESIKPTEFLLFICISGPTHKLLQHCDIKSGISCYLFELSKLYTYKGDY